MRGSMKGGLWGLVLGGMGLGLTSLAYDQPIRSEAPKIPQLVTPQIVQASPTPSDLAPIAPEITADVVQIAPRVSEPFAEENTPVLETQPAAPPQTADFVTLLDAPVDVALPEVSNEVDAAIVPSVKTQAPQMPPAEDDVVVDTQPAEPETIVVTEVEPAPAEGLPETPEEEVIPAEVIAALPTEEAASADVIVEVAPEAPPESPAKDVAAAPAPDPQQPAADVVVDQVPTATALPTVNSGVRVNRPSAELTESAGQDAVVIEAEPIPDDAPALLRYAAVSENPDNLPMISIILLDLGEMTDAALAVAGLGFLPTVAVNALADDAASTMAAYRTAGIEVAMQAMLPDGARPSDVEVTFEAAFGILPEAAMLFSDGTGALQNDRSVTAQVMEILAADGRGFVSVQRGLGNAVRAAEQADVAAATILRDLDGAGEDQAAIARALDQAAFRARQSGGAILMGRVTPATLEALRDWAADLDARQLMIVPVSAILLNQAE